VVSGESSLLCYATSVTEINQGGPVRGAPQSFASVTLMYT
jgi:hypothetical protein